MVRNANILYVCREYEIRFVLIIREFSLYVQTAVYICM